MLQLGPVELLIIFVIFLIFFGAGKLGDLGGALRKSVTAFKANAGLDKPKQDPQKQLES